MACREPKKGNPSDHGSEYDYPPHRKERAKLRLEHPLVLLETRTLASSTTVPKNRQVVPGPVGFVWGSGGRNRARGLLARSERDGRPGCTLSGSPDAMISPEDRNVATVGALLSHSHHPVALVGRHRSWDDGHEGVATHALAEERRVGNAKICRIT